MSHDCTQLGTSGSAFGFATRLYMYRPGCAVALHPDTSERVRESIEKSIIALEEERKDTEGRQALIDNSVTDLEGLVSKDKSLFSEYRGRIQEVLKKPEDEKKPALAGLIVSLLLQEEGIKIALSSVTQKALRSTVLVFAPPAGLEPAT